MHKKLLIICVLLLCATYAHAQVYDEESRKWNQPVKPFKIIGNVYYVGATEVSSYLITTSQGHILLDSGFAETVPQIKQNVAQLGFRFEDVKILITSHAHADHVGGVAMLKQMTGAQLAVSIADAEMLKRGGKNDPNFGDRFLFQGVIADRKLRDGDTVQLGDVTMTARLTPGHTKGCTTWTMKVSEGGKQYDVVIIGSTSAPGYKLIGNAGYPNIVEDYESSFRLLKTLPCDVFLAPHGSFFALLEKIKHLGEPQNPFIDKDDFPRYVERSEQAFRAELKRQQDALKVGPKG
ncbi:MAG TPA: subclass B3 metallo-beta-lactamase [Pyrinomonadaceae bacterium]|nr:subclass B3 metallo-beta-lactamase [Pyrinomonadaceae bacterium]